MFNNVKIATCFG